ncbi:MAG: V-type ATP synthase subunit E [Firmicutes bacterium]|nr:V-type ATP synthase subunit E [Bacillota bacterium]
MSIEKITSKILSEASELKEKTLSEARKESDAVLAEAEKKAQEMIEDSKKRGLEEKEKIISRRKSVADIDCRKVFLAKKQEIIGQCFDKAVDEIISMDEADYIGLLTALGTGSRMTAGQLIFNEKERAAIGQKVVDALNGSAEGRSFVLSEETRKLRGGYMLMCGQTFINNTIEALVEEARPELVAEVAKIMFPA